MIPTYQSPVRTPMFATAMLVLTLLQASSFLLSLAFRGPLASDTLVSMVTMLWLAMYAFATIGLFASFGMNWVTWMVRYRLLLTFVLAGTAFSISWSVDQALSIERSVHLLGTSIVAVYIGFSLPLNRILRISAYVLGFIMLTSVAAALFLPELGMEDYQGVQVWAGTLAAKNTLGFWSAVTFLLTASLCFWTIPNYQRLLFAAVAGLSLLCLYNSVSATSLLALITAGLVMLYLHAAFSLRLSIVAMTMLGVLVAGLVGVAFYFIDIAELSGRSGDLTGRGEVWAQTWKLILERPLTGYGYGTIWYPTADSLYIQQSLTDFTWTVFHAHNGLLQIASEIGLPLAALAVLMIVQQLVEITYCQYQRQQPGVLFVLGFTIALLVSNYSEARLLVNRDLYWIFFIALPISMLHQVSGIAKNQTSTSSGLSSGGPHKLREARQRKEEKKVVKERLKNLRVVNDPDSANQAGDVANDKLSNATASLRYSQALADKQDAGSPVKTESIIEVKSKRVAHKGKAQKLKNRSRNNQTG